MWAGRGWVGWGWPEVGLLPAGMSAWGSNPSTAAQAFACKVLSSCNPHLLLLSAQSSHLQRV